MYKEILQHLLFSFSLQFKLPRDTHSAPAFLLVSIFLRVSAFIGMAYGILEYHGSLEHVPGTAQLEDVLSERTAHLKKGKGGDSHIILVPQPSNDPNDPLNWPLWQRDAILLLYCFCTLMCVGG